MDVTINELTILQTIEQFGEFDARLIAAYCPANEKEVTQVVRQHEYCFTEVIVRRSSDREPRWRLDDSEKLRQVIDELTSGALVPARIEQPPRPAPRRGRHLAERVGT
jgi:hypothetical protein